MPICEVCGNHFDPDDYMNDSMQDETSVCPDCYYAGDQLFDDRRDDHDPDFDDLDVDPDDPDAEDAIPEGFFDDIPEDDDSGFEDESEFDEYLDALEADSDDDDY